RKGRRPSRHLLQGATPSDRRAEGAGAAPDLLRQRRRDPGRNGEGRVPDRVVPVLPGGDGTRRTYQRRRQSPRSPASGLRPQERGFFSILSRGNRVDPFTSSSEGSPDKYWPKNSRRMARIVS